jgi:hypothetical protein
MFLELNNFVTIRWRSRALAELCCDFRIHWKDTLSWNVPGYTPVNGYGTFLGNRVWEVIDNVGLAFFRWFPGFGNSLCDNGVIQPPCLPYPPLPRYR